MPDYAFSPAALARYEDLEADPQLWPVVDRLDDVIERLAATPGAAEFRRHRWQSPPAFAVGVRAGGADWMVLWEQVGEHEAYENLRAGDVHVLYVGLWPGS